jgi:hypothetical protein
MKLKLLNLNLLFTFLSCTAISFAQSSAYEVADWKGFRTSTVTFSFDDNCANQFSNALPIFDKYGFKATFNPVINWGPNWATLKSMAANGHEIASHSVTHPSSAMNETELANSKNTINSNIPGFDCNTVAYPNCVVPDQNTCAKYYIGGRVCNGQIEGKTPRNYYQIGSIICGNQGSCNSASNFESQFNSAKSRNGWVVFLVHEVDNGSGYSPLASSVIEQSLNYLSRNDKDFWVTTFRNAILYSKERDAVKITELSNTDSEITMSLTDNLDNATYNYPLSLRRALPNGWTEVAATQDGKEITASITDGYIYFDAVPDGGTVTLTSGAESGPATTIAFTEPAQEGSWEVGNTETISWEITNPASDTYSLYWNVGGEEPVVAGATASSEWSTEDGSFSWRASNILQDTDENRWAASDVNGLEGEWVALELTSLALVSGVIIKENAEYPGVSGFDIEYSTDGITYTSVKSGTTIGSDYSTSFSPVSAKYIRLFITSATYVNIDYMTVTGGAQKTEIASVITASGSYEWEIDNTHQGETGYLTIENTQKNRVMATSASISIKGNPEEDNQEKGNPTLINQTESENADFYITPNPAKDYFVVHSKKAIQKIEIYTMDGRLIFTVEDTQEVQLSSFTKGIYLVKTHLEEGNTKTSKIVIE